MTKPSVSSSSSLYADVAPAIPLPVGKSQVFTYRTATDEIPSPRSIVQVPVGARSVPGIVLAVHRRQPAYKTKILSRVYPLRLTDGQVEFARWIAHTMQGGLGFTLRLFTPPARLTEPPAKWVGLPSASKDGRQVAAVVGVSRQRWKKLRSQVSQEVGLGRQVLIIVPEVPMIKMVATRLGRLLQEVTLLYHADLAASRLGAAWQQVQSGQACVVVGTQKALFLPWQHLSLLIVEEEQLPTHKLWDQYPKLHNKTAAVVLAVIHQAHLVYSSSYPSLELWHNVAQRHIKKNIWHPPVLKTSIVPLSFEDRRQHRLLPEEFLEQLKGWIKQKERTLILCNQRGFWQAARCRSCRAAVVCPECHKALAVHGSKTQRILVCHQCGFEQPLPQQCPACQSTSFKFSGVGTQTIEHVLKHISVYTKDIVRIDTDTVAGRSPRSLEKELRRRSVVLGTSAVFKYTGDTAFDRVVWLFPERSLLYPDIRSAEQSVLLASRLQQHLRSSRRRLVLVTRREQLVADHLSGAVERVYAPMLQERKRLSYPPFNELIRLTVSSKQAQNAAKRAQQIREMIEARIPQKTENILIRGPFQGFQKTRRQKHEYHLLLIGPLPRLTALYDGLPVDAVDVRPQRIL